MKITKAASRNPDAESHIVYGNHPDTGKWLERWFATKEKAIKYVDKRNWNWSYSID